jgi:hypothetical protein
MSAWPQKAIVISSSFGMICRHWVTPASPIAELRKPLSSLTHEDLLIYRRLLADPQPAQP